MDGPIPSLASGKMPRTDSAMTWAAEWRMASISVWAPASRSSSTEPRTTASKKSSDSAGAAATAGAAAAGTLLSSCAPISSPVLLYGSPADWPLITAADAPKNAKPPVRQDERYLSRFHPPSRRCLPISCLAGGPSLRWSLRLFAHARPGALARMLGSASRCIRRRVSLLTAPPRALTAVTGGSRAGCRPLTGGVCAGRICHRSQPRDARRRLSWVIPAGCVPLIALNLELAGAVYLHGPDVPDAEFPLRCVVGGRGLEPLASCMSSMPSNQLS